MMEFQEYFFIEIDWTIFQSVTFEIDSILGLELNQQ